MDLITLIELMDYEFELLEKLLDDESGISRLEGSKMDTDKLCGPI